MSHLIVLDGDSRKSFKKIIFDQCQKELARDEVTMLDARNQLEDVHACVDPVNWHFFPFHFVQM